VSPLSPPLFSVIPRAGFSVFWNHPFRNLCIVSTFCSRLCFLRFLHVWILSDRFFSPVVLFSMLDTEQGSIYGLVPCFIFKVPSFCILFWTYAVVFFIFRAALFRYLILGGFFVYFFGTSNPKLPCFTSSGNSPPSSQFSWVSQIS